MLIYSGAGAKNDRDIRRNLAERCRQFLAGHFRHRQIRNHQVAGSALKEVQRFRAVGGGEDRIANPLQNSREDSSASPRRAIAWREANAPLLFRLGRLRLGLSALFAQFVEGFLDLAGDALPLLAAAETIRLMPRSVGNCIGQ